MIPRTNKRKEKSERSRSNKNGSWNHKNFKQCTRQGRVAQIISKSIRSFKMENLVN